MISYFEVLFGGRNGKRACRLLCRILVAWKGLASRRDADHDLGGRKGYSRHGPAEPITLLLVGYYGNAHESI